MSTNPETRTNGACPLVSVAMCTYNGERFLREQMDSLVAQDYPNLEILVSDDCSTDTTLAILKEYEQRHENISVTQSEGNLGLVKNFQGIIARCSGDYIALCDQDDIWFPNKISTLVAEIGAAALIYTPTEMIDENGMRMNTTFHDLRNIQLVDGKCYKSLIFENCILGHTILFKRSLLEHALPFPAGITAHDQWLAIIAAIHGNIKLHKEPVSYYRKHGDNLSLKKNRPKLIWNFWLRRERRSRALKKKHQNAQVILEALCRMEALTADERQLLEKLKRAHALFYRIWYNQPLAGLLQKHAEEFLAIPINKPKAIRKLCRGYLTAMLR